MKLPKFAFRFFFRSAILTGGLALALMLGDTAMQGGKHQHDRQIGQRTLAAQGGKHQHDRQIGTFAILGGKHQHDRQIGSKA